MLLHSQLSCFYFLTCSLCLLQPFPLLESGCPMALTLSQLQVACLVANMFLCTFYPNQRKAYFELTPIRRASVTESASTSSLSSTGGRRQMQPNEWHHMSASQTPAPKPSEKKTRSPSKRGASESSSGSSGTTTASHEASSIEMTETLPPPPGLLPQAQAQLTGAASSKSPSSSQPSKQRALSAMTYWGEAMMCSAIALQDPGWDDDQLKIPDAASDARSMQPRQPPLLPIPARQSKARAPSAKNKRRICEDNYQTVNFNSYAVFFARGCILKCLHAYVSIT